MWIDREKVGELYRGIYGEEIGEDMVERLG